MARPTTRTPRTTCGRGRRGVLASNFRSMRFETKGDGGLEAEVDALVKGHPDTKELVRTVSEKYQARLTERDFNPDPDELDGQAPPMPRDVVLKAARQFYRTELTNLEQFVLIQIFDQS